MKRSKRKNKKDCSTVQMSANMTPKGSSEMSANMTPKNSVNYGRHMRPCQSFV